jgi:hypothetical protein
VEGGYRKVFRDLSWVSKAWDDWELSHLWRGLSRVTSDIQGLGVGKQAPPSPGLSRCQVLLGFPESHPEICPGKNEKVG